MPWLANLDDGTTVKETDPIAGEISAWQKLLKRCRDGEVSIRGLQLIAGNMVLEAMPYKMCDGYYQARMEIFIMNQGLNIQRQGIGSVIGDLVFITWIDLKMSKYGKYTAYQQIRPLSEEKIHTTIK